MRHRQAIDVYATDIIAIGRTPLALVPEGYAAPVPAIGGFLRSEEAVAGRDDQRRFMKLARARATPNRTDGRYLESLPTAKQ